MNKEELRNRIMELPKFQKSDCCVQFTDGKFHIQENHKAIREVQNEEAICFVSPRYNLVQFEDIALPIVDNIPNELIGNVHYFDGRMIMDLFPNSPEWLKDNTQFGLTLVNSVDKTTSLVIKFSVWHKGNCITFPKAIAGFKRNHSKSNLLNYAKTYGVVISKVQNEWATITSEFPKIKLDEKSVREILKDEKLNFTDEMKQAIFRLWFYKNKDFGECNLWDFFEFCISYIGNKSYKSEYHKRQNMDKLIEKIMQYGFLTKFAV